MIAYSSGNLVQSTIKKNQFFYYLLVPINLININCKAIMDYSDKLATYDPRSSVSSYFDSISDYDCQPTHVDQQRTNSKLCQDNSSVSDSYEPLYAPYPFSTVFDSYEPEPLYGPDPFSTDSIDNSDPDNQTRESLDESDSSDEPNPEFDALVKQSELFATEMCSFPIASNRIKTIAISPKLKKEVVNHAKNTRIIMHEKVNELIDDFLEVKKSAGSSQEKALYQTMSRRAFINRLLIKRPLVFITSADISVLRDGNRDSHDWTMIGKDNSTSLPIDNSTSLSIEDYLTYDELQISALLGVSTPTIFINDGNRNNRGCPDDKHEHSGIHTALVGARFERDGLMETQHILIYPDFITSDDYFDKPISQSQELSAIWAKFYGLSKFPTVEDIDESDPNYARPRENGPYFNMPVYKKRMEVILIPFFDDANDRAYSTGNQAYIHLVGLGLGGWVYASKQGTLISETVAFILETYTFPNISDINFSWYPRDVISCGGVHNNEIFNSNGNTIKMHFSKRNPSAKLVGEDEGKLLVVSYAWDSNAFPGNEYWRRMLTASGDPAAACSSTISELQNPYINPQFLDNIFVAPSSQ